MCKVDIKNGDTRIDPCMRNLIKYLKNKYKPILSCCGHGKYNPTVIVKEHGKINGKRVLIVLKFYFTRLVD